MRAATRHGTRHEFHENSESVYFSSRVTPRWGRMTRLAAGSQTVKSGGSAASPSRVSRDDSPCVRARAHLAGSPAPAISRTENAAAAEKSDGRDT